MLYFFTSNGNDNAVTFLDNGNKYNRLLDFVLNWLISDVGNWMSLKNKCHFKNKSSKI